MDTDDPATDAFKRELGFAGMPTFVLIDAEGNIIRHWVGRVSEEALSAALLAALSGQPQP